MKLNTPKKLAQKKAANIVASDISTSKKIVALLEGGYTIREIADMLGIRYQFAYNVASNYINKDRLESRIVKAGSSKKEQIRTMYAEGKSVKEIAQALSTYQNYVYKVVSDIAKEAMSK